MIAGPVPTTVPTSTTPLWTVTTRTPPPTPAQVLERNVVLHPVEIAYVLGLLHQRGQRKGQPDRRAALELIKAGRLPLTDPTQSITRWTVPAAAVRKYIDGAA